MAYLLSSAVLMVLLLAAGVTALGEHRLRHPRIPWLAVTLVALALAGLLVQHAGPVRPPRSTRTRAGPAGGGTAPRCSCRTGASAARCSTW